MLKTKSIVIIIALLICTSTYAQKMNQLRSGKLSNGLTYYIKHSSLQKEKVSFQLVQNVGAILEDDTQIGLAHFLEHMAFNGTRRFPNGVMPYLKGKGLYTFNATTGIDNTTYEIINVPTTDQGFVDSCMLILRDWCDGILLKDNDINQERGVIIEEWRGRAGVTRRMQEATVPIVYNHSKYAKRNIIGSLETLEHFSPETLRQFYATWYRPDLQAIIVVGDIDETLVEEKFKTLFSDIKAKENAKPRPKTEIEENLSPDYALILEAENKTRSFTLYQRTDKLKKASYGERRIYSMSSKIFNSVLKNRIAALKNDNSEEFLSASASFESLIGDYNAFAIEITPLNKKDKVALEQVMTLVEELRRYGITEDEMEQMQEQIFQALKDFERNMDKSTNSYYTNVFTNNFLHNGEIIDQKEEILNSKEILLDMTKEDVQKWITSWDSDKNMALVIYCNTSDYNYITKQDFNSLIETVRKKEIAEIERKREKIEFFNNDLREVAIKKTTPIKKFEAEEWLLENGAKVIYKYTEEGRGNFGFAASSHGGRSIVKEEDLPSLTAMETLVLKSGISKYDRATVRDVVSGKNMNVNFFFTEFTEGFGGSSTTDNAELFFKFAHLMFTEPRFTREAFDKYIEQSKYLYQNGVKTAMDIVSDSMRVLTTKKTPRTREMNLEYIDDMKFESIERLYKERMSNAADFTFCIVGDIEREQAMSLIARYIGTLPAGGKKEKYVVRDYATKPSNVEKVFTADLPDNKALVDMTFNNTRKMSDKEQLAFTVFGTILSNRFFELVREEQGGTYGVNSDARYSNFPKRESTLSIHFETENSKADELKSIIKKELESSRTVPYSIDDLNQVIIGLKRNKAMADENMNIQYWMNVLNYYIEYKVDITSPKNFEAIIDKINTREIMKISDKFFKKATLRDVIVKSNE